MTVIWGLDLKEVQWKKFKGAYMFNRVYHLRRTKMMVYQAAMIFCVVSESVGTVMLSGYVDQQDGISTRSHGQAQVQNDDVVGIASFNIFVGIAVATVFGAAFFFDLFWPERIETKAVRLSWKISAVAVSIMVLADALALTVIVGTHRAYIIGVPPEYAQTLFDENGPPNPIYRKNAMSVASSVLLWLGVIATFSSTYIMWRSLQHDDQFGPWSKEYENGRTLPI
ncbi:hypothetical protein V496_07639 [Pseudogymnoascus sp. VKM F-4515 (FW-2607)]|nr:hypothetical protein V496_07639 [Pseudogymnoascus sp. VKM F-4515 (FW-2607)]KFY98117.1 hypothetical protein V498_01670 [Pseudogymnoascus sp. VKM F-4517 (FW-2822)]